MENEEEKIKRLGEDAETALIRHEAWLLAQGLIDEKGNKTELGKELENFGEETSE